MAETRTTAAEQLPPGRWVRTWGAALLLLVLGAAALELTLRVLGVEPSTYDDAGLWALVREDMPEGDPSLLALVGSSRMQCDIDVDVLAEETGMKPVMLAIVSGSAAPVLHDLALDDGFVGDVLLEISPTIVFKDEPAFRTHVEGRIQTRRDMQRSLFAFAERRVHRFIQSHLAMQHGELDLFDILISAARGKLPIPSTRFRGDRERYFYGDTVEPWTDVPPPAPEEIRLSTTTFAESVMAGLATDVEAIERRGGEVFLLMLPSGGQNRAGELRDFPRAYYWDRAVELLAVPGHHWTDSPETAGLRPADPSHLDAADARVYTRAISVWYKTHSSPIAPEHHDG